MTSRDDGTWLTEPAQLAGAKLNDIRRSLVTGDGRGYPFKDLAFKELLMRAAQGRIDWLDVQELYGDIGTSNEKQTDTGAGAHQL